MTKLSTPSTERWFIFHNDQLLVPTEQDLVLFLSSSLIEYIKPHLLRHIALGNVNDCQVYCAELMPDSHLPDTMCLIPFRRALDLLSADWYNVAAKALAIVHWDSQHQYCGRCGNPTDRKKPAFERICRVCSQIFYPRISPSVIVRIAKDDHILMARSPHFTKGAYGLIAGFVEAGESLENAVHREVKEEVNIAIKNLRYFGSQAWPFPDSLMVAYTADYDLGDIEIDRIELEHAGWYRFDQLPGRPSSRISLSSQLIDDFIAQHSRAKG